MNNIVSLSQPPGEIAPVTTVPLGMRFVAGDVVSDAEVAHEPIQRVVVVGGPYVVTPRVSDRAPAVYYEIEPTAYKRSPTEGGRWFISADPPLVPTSSVALSHKARGW